MAAEKAFIVPVVIDGTRESTALVPDKFRAVQWTRLINQDDTQGLVAQVQRLLVREPQTEPGIRPVETGTAIALGAYGAAGIRGKPSIAVLPFTNMSGDPEQDYFADGMVEDIITALSRFNQLFVIARNSSFIEQVQDYTNYSHAYQAYYQCAFPPATAQTRCIPPSLIRRLQLKTGLGLIP